MFSSVPNTAVTGFKKEKAFIQLLCKQINACISFPAFVKADAGNALWAVP